MPGSHLCLVNSMRGWGGAEVWFLETAKALQARGHRVSVIAQPDSQLLARCRREDIAVYPLAIRFDAAFWTLARLVSYFRNQHVTAILANLTKDLKAAAVAGKMASVPIILGSRESDFPLKDKAYYRWYFNNLSTGLLVNSQATRATTLKSAPYLHPERVHLLYKGINLERFRPEKHKTFNTVGFAGQLIPRKGLQTLLEAWQRIECLQEVNLKIAGDGIMMPELRTWRNNLQYPDRVEILGAIEDMALFYQNLDFLVMPSLSEGFGLVAAEALACATPVIATDTSSLPEIITHGKTGFLIPVNNPEALSAAMLKMLKTPEETREMGLAGRAHVQKNFNREDTLDQLEILTGLVFRKAGP